MAINREYKMYIKIAGEVNKSLPDSVKLTKSELRSIAREASTSSTSMATSFRQGINETKPMFDKIGNVAKKAFKTVVTAASAASVAIGSFAINTGMDFESQMSTVKALSQASETEMNQLNKTAKHLGATTVWTAEESGKAMEYMAQAGWNTKKIVDAVPATMDLASASGEDLGEVSDIVTDSMTAFNLKAKEAGHFTDVLAEASAASNTDVGKLGESFKYVAPLAGALGYNIEDTSFALGLMANNGIKASQAGTSMRSWLTRLAKPTKESYAAMKKLGLSLEDSQGKMEPLRTIIDETRTSFNGLSKSQKAKYASMLAGKAGMSGLLAIVNSTNKDYGKLYESIQECDGAAKEMADTKLDNLEGDVTLFKSALDGAGLTIYDEIKEPLREVVSDATKWVGELTEGFETNFPTIRRYVSETGEALGKLAQPLLEVGGWLLDHPDVLVGTITGIGGALASYKIVSGITSLATSLTQLSSAGGAVLGLTATVGIVSGIAGAITEADKRAKEASLSEHFGDIALNMEEIQSISKEIVGSKKLEKVDELLDSMSKSEGVADEIEDANKVIKKMNWKVSAGIELSDEDSSEYENSVRQYISSVQSLIDEKGYSVKMSTSLLFDDSYERTQLFKDNDFFYKDLDEQVTSLSDTINKKLKKGIKKGFSPDLQNEINGLLDQMSEITDALNGAETEASWDFLETKWSGKDLDADSFKNLKKEIQDNIEEINDGAESAYKEGITNAEAKKRLGYIDEEQYNAEVEKYKKAYQKTTEETKEKGIEFLLNTTLDTYGKEFLDGTLSSADKGAMNDMLEDIQEMGPSYATENDIRNMQLALSSNMLTGINDFLETSQGGKKEGLWESAEREAKEYVMDYFDGTDTGENSKFIGPSKVEITEENKKKVMDSISESITPSLKIDASEVNVDPVSSKIKEDLKDQLEDGVSAEIPIQATGTVDPPISFLYKDNKKSGTKSVKKHAKGGIFSTPHIGMVAEAGNAEAIIPIDGSENAYNLLGQTANLLGIGDGFSALATKIISFSNGEPAVGHSAEKQSSQPIVVQYSPNIVVNGNADKSTIQGVLNDDYEKFKRYMKRWSKEGKRLSLA